METSSYRKVANGSHGSRGPAHPMYATVPARLESFKDWPISLKQKPKEMVDAGYFYMGSGDKTVCFYCGVGMKDWEETDDPWVEHAKWSPNCDYLVLKMSDEMKNGLSLKIKTNSKETKETSKTTKKSVEKKLQNGESSKQKVEDSNISSDSGANEINSKTTCKVCYDEDVDIALVPCGHTVCKNCFTALDKCHVCRKPIEGYVRLYMS